MHLVTREICASNSTCLLILKIYLVRSPDKHRTVDTYRDDEFKSKLTKSQDVMVLSHCHNGKCFMFSLRNGLHWSLRKCSRDDAWQRQQQRYHDQMGSMPNCDGSDIRVFPYEGAFCRIQ